MEKLSLFVLLFCIYVTVDAKIDVQIGKDCKLSCPKIRKPVCGSNGKMYDNACLMKLAACKQKKVILPITKCPKLLYHVCGSDGKRYNNLCELALASCRTKGGLHRLAACPRIRNPVCGSDGEEYDNECLLRLEACQDGKEISVVKCKE